MRNDSRYDNSTINSMGDLYESTMMNKSEGQIIQENLEDGTLEEGWWDRAKMRGKQAVGAVQGAGQQLKGKAQQAAGNVVNKVGNAVQQGVQAVGGQIEPSQNKITQAGQNLQQQGQQNVQQGQQLGQQRLVQAATQISQARTTQLLGDISNDLKKVGINAQIPQTEIKRIQTVIANAINRAMSGTA